MDCQYVFIAAPSRDRAKKSAVPTQPQVRTKKALLFVLYRFPPGFIPNEPEKSANCGSFVRFVFHLFHRLFHENEFSPRFIPNVNGNLHKTKRRFPPFCTKFPDLQKMKRQTRYREKSRKTKRNRENEGYKSKKPPKRA